MTDVTTANQESPLMPCFSITKKHHGIMLCISEQSVYASCISGSNISSCMFDDLDIIKKKHRISLKYRMSWFSVSA